MLSNDHISREMAMSGEYEDSWAIEMALRRDGFPEARILLTLPTRRRQLNKLCRDARRKKSS